MSAIEFSLEGVKLFTLSNFEDARGFFRETFRKSLYEQAGIACDFVQDNHSFSKKDVLRGMHFQRVPGQAKLITVISGEIFDVFVDMRPASPTFGKWEGVVLNAEKGDQLFIPEGYAHGFCVLSESAHLCYKVSSLYDPAEEKTFRYDDPTIGIQWPVSNPIISKRDQNAPYFEEVIA